MANRFLNPLAQFVDSAGDTLSGGKLFFYETTTSTKLDTYSDEALSSANSNPVVLDSSGRLPNNVFLKNQDYKVILAPSTDADPPTSAIWTADPVRSSDFDSRAELKVGSGAPGGSVAGTASSASVLPTQYWDFTGKILYFCTTTGSTSTAVWTGINTAAATALAPHPTGRLTLTSATPVLAAGVSAGTSVYYTPYLGNQIPIYDGSAFTPTTFSELTLTLNATPHLADTIYDMYIWLESGVVTIGTGPAWADSGEGAGDRGTGASTAEITRILGFNVNANSMTMKNGTTTYSGVGANLATYVGSILIDGSAAQISCHTARGQTRRWGVWNAYNRRHITLLTGDDTATWDYNSATWRQSRATAGNHLKAFVGLPEESIEIVHNQRIGLDAVATGNIMPQVGIGVNSTTAPSGVVGSHRTNDANAAGIQTQGSGVAMHTVLPTIGLMTINCIESVDSSTGDFFGGADDHRMSAKWMG